MRAAVAVLLLIASPGLAVAQPSSAPPPETPAANTRAPMQFRMVEEAADRCAGRCREWVIANGSIVEATPREFERFTQGRNLRGVTVVIDSVGGSVEPAIALGRRLRELGLNTAVGKLMPVPGGAGSDRTAMVPAASCRSMCAFLLLAGVERHVPERSRVAIHQIWPGSRRDDANAAVYSAAHLASVQRILGQVARYIADMGGDMELFELATRIPPWENLRLISREELGRFRLHTNNQLLDPRPIFVRERDPLPPAEASPKATEVGRDAVKDASKNAAAVAPAQNSWSLVERAGRRLLARRHPITVEGETIGNFEIAFACADRPDAYRVLYLERRKGRAGASVAPLDAVGVSVGRERSMLRVASSKREPSGLEVATVAQGLASTAMLSALTASDEGSNVSLLIRTSADDKLQTAIRLGRTGLSKDLLGQLCQPRHGEASAP